MISHRSITALLVCASILIATPAAALWSETFKPEAVASYQEQEGQQYIVIAAGDRQQSAPAAQSLTAALRTAGAKMVMDDKSLGDVSQLDDAAIVAKAAKLPIQQIVIVRIFETAPDAPSMAVVTTYDKDANVLWALSATEGEPLAAAQASGPAKPGKAGVAIGKLHENQTVGTSEARKKFDENFLWGLQYASGADGYLSHDFFYPKRGKYSEQLTNEQFYEALDRPDLLEQYKSNSTMNTISNYTMGAGYLGVIGFGTWAFVGWLGNIISDDSYERDMKRYEEELADYPGRNPQTPAKPDRHNQTLSLSLTGASLAVAIIGHVISPKTVHPIKTSEAAKLIDEHNDKLKEDLGLSSDYSPMSTTTQQPMPSRFQYDFDLAAGADNAEVRFRLDF